MQQASWYKITIHISFRLCFVMWVEWRTLFWAPALLWLELFGNLELLSPPLSSLSILATSVTVVQPMLQQLYIIIHLVEMVVGIASQLYISCESQIIRATWTYIIEGGELLMQRMLREESRGESGSRIQSSLNHDNFEAQSVYSILITIHNLK